VFFFRAEDAIRDFHVTGVQTCALPISGRRCRSAKVCRDTSEKWQATRWSGEISVSAGAVTLHSGRAIGHLVWKAQPLGALIGEEIGRASWRERVERGVEGGALVESEWV